MGQAGELGKAYIVRVTGRMNGRSRGEHPFSHFLKELLTWTSE